jgi:uncharacterized protein (DUF1501 family)
MKRRRFLKNSLLAGLPLVFPLPDLLSLASEAKNVVFIHLAGGNDGYNTLVPFSSQQYYLKRPTLAVAADEVIKLTATHGLNPAMSSLTKHYNANELMFINNVGFGDHEPSHYTASSLWNNAFASGQENTKGADLKSDLNHIASEIGNTRTKLFSVTMDGFDTHQFQRQKHDSLLREYSEAMSSFIDRLKKEGKFKSTLIITWSEFGRKLEQNNRKGTDHGNENLVIVAGGNLKEKGSLNADGSVLLSPLQTYNRLLNTSIV